MLIAVLRHFREARLVDSVVKSGEGGEGLKRRGEGCNLIHDKRRSVENSLGAPYFGSKILILNKTRGREIRFNSAPLLLFLFIAITVKFAVF